MANKMMKKTKAKMNEAENKAHELKGKAEQKIEDMKK